MYFTFEPFPSSASSSHQISFSRRRDIHLTNQPTKKNKNPINGKNERKCNVQSILYTTDKIPIPHTQNPYIQHTLCTSTTHMPHLNLWRKKLIPEECWKKIPSAENFLYHIIIILSLSSSILREKYHNILDDTLLLREYNLLNFLVIQKLFLPRILLQLTKKIFIFRSSVSHWIKKNWIKTVIKYSLIHLLYFLKVFQTRFSGVACNMHL